MGTVLSVNSYVPTKGEGPIRAEVELERQRSEKAALQQQAGAQVRRAPGPLGPSKDSSVALSTVGSGT